MLKNSNVEIISLLTTTKVTWFLRSASVPGDWEAIRVKLIFKKRARRDAGNYRVVSLMFVQGKLVENIKYKMIKHLEEQVLKKNQHDFCGCTLSH